MNHSLFDFAPAVFWKVLAATLTLVMLGWIGAMWTYGELKTVDIVGSLISAPILAYLVHLRIVYGKSESPGDEMKPETVGTGITVIPAPRAYSAWFAQQGPDGKRDICGRQCPRRPHRARHLSKNAQVAPSTTAVLRVVRRWSVHLPGDSSM